MTYFNSISSNPSLRRSQAWVKTLSVYTLNMCCVLSAVIWYCHINKTVLPNGLWHSGVFSFAAMNLSGFLKKKTLLLEYHPSQLLDV